MRFGFDARMPFSSLMIARNSLISASSLPISRAVSRAKRMLRIASLCFSVRSKRFRNAVSADPASFDLRMIFMTSSMLSTAIVKPSSRCSRASA